MPVFFVQLIRNKRMPGLRLPDFLKLGSKSAVSLRDGETVEDVN